MLTDGAEIALLDVREELAFGGAHIFSAGSMPLSRLEMLAPVLVPRRTARLVLCGDELDDAHLAADRLEAFGYRDVAVLEDGIERGAQRAMSCSAMSTCRARRLENGSSMYVARHRFLPTSWPKCSPETMTSWCSTADLEEYSRRAIPTGICVPGGELVYRVHDLAPSPETLVVVNCAGRSRSILGAQSLINAGFRIRWSRCAMEPWLVPCRSSSGDRRRANLRRTQ